MSYSAPTGWGEGRTHLAPVVEFPARFGGSALFEQLEAPIFCAPGRWGRHEERLVAFWIGIGVAMGIVALLSLIGGAMANGRSRDEWRRRDGGPWVPGEHDRFDDWR